MTILEDVTAMIETLQADANYGPYTLYVNPRVFGFTNDRRIARRWARERETSFVTHNLKPRLYEVPYE